MSPALTGWFLTTEPSGKSPGIYSQGLSSLYNFLSSKESLGIQDLIYLHRLSQGIIKEIKFPVVFRMLLTNMLQGSSKISKEIQLFKKI